MHYFLKTFCVTVGCVFFVELALAEDDESDRWSFEFRQERLSSFLDGDLLANERAGVRHPYSPPRAIAQQVTSVFLNSMDGG
jgi:hypothetical protein